MNGISSRQFRVALLGAGNISTEHAAVLLWMPNTKIMAVCDLYEERAKELSDKFGIPEVFTSLDEMLEKTKPDVVHVLLPPDAHVRFASQCLKSGSHVFVEKPIGITVAECSALMQVASVSQRNIGVNHNYIYRPVVQQLIDQIRARRFGRIVHVNIAWSMPPSKLENVSPNSFFLQAPQNPLFEWAVHPLSIIHRLLGKVEGVETLISGERFTETGGTIYTTWQSSLLCDRGTAQLLISVGYGFDCLWMDVLGEDAFAHVDMFNDSIIIGEYTPYRPAVNGFRDVSYKSASLFASAIRNAKDYVLSGLGHSSSPASTHQAGMRNSIRSFYDALKSNSAPPEGIEQGMAVVDYCEQIFKSAFSAEHKGDS